MFRYIIIFQELVFLNFVSPRITETDDDLLLYRIISSKWPELGPEMAPELEGFRRTKYDQTEAEFETWEGYVLFTYSLHELNTKWRGCCIVYVLVNMTFMFQRCPINQMQHLYIQ